MAYSPVDDLNLSLDYYTIKIEDVIQLNSPSPSSMTN